MKYLLHTDKFAAVMAFVGIVLFACGVYINSVSTELSGLVIVIVACIWTLCSLIIDLEKRLESLEGKKVKNK